MATDKQPLLKERTPTLNYTKRYDQVSWRSADTDFEVDPSASSADESSRPNVKTSIFHLCTKRQRKLIALVVVIVTFLAIMSGLIYLYYSKSSDTEIEETSAVSTDAGPVSGVIETIEVDGVSKRTFLFKGIPYAVPPIGKLRFSPPVAINQSNGWKNRYRAIKFSSPCVQVSNNGDIEGTEDCLYLNVFTPSLSQSNLPVILWIHGGSLMVGNGNSPGYSPNSEFVTSMNVVAVSMNYRLNAFGFLTLKELWEEGKSYGNYGIMDQILVLKWIQNNIKNFGGNPNSVTIAGQSSGGTSIFGLLSSPLADGLFHKAIPMSGSPKFTIGYEQASRENRVFINNSRCKSANESQIKECLYGLNSEEVFHSIPFSTYPNWEMRDLLDFPTKGLFDGALIVIDPVVIKTSPQNMSQNDFKTNVSILTGTTAQEIAFDPAHFFANYSLMKSFFNKRLTQFSPSYPSIVLNDLYNTSEFNKKDPQFLYTTISTDVRVTCPTNLIREFFSKSSSRISYQYIVESSPSKKVLVPFVERPLQYAFHAWDSIALFDFVMISEYGFKPTAVDINFKEVYRRVISEFMKSGNLDYFQWKPDQTAVFVSNGSVNVLSTDYHAKQCDFWNNVNNGFTLYSWIN